MSTDTSRTLAVWKRRLPGFLMAAPAVIVFVGLFLIPMALAFVLSFTNWNGFSLNFEWLGFDNYANAFKDARSVNAGVYSTILAVVGTVISNCLGLGIAILISAPGRANTVARTIFFYPFILSSLIIGFLWSALLNPQGVVNSMIKSLGGDGIPFLTDLTLAKVTVILTIVWAEFGFCMILYIAGLKSIPAEFYEAATVDGAGRWAQFRHITLPMLAPIVTVNLVLTLIGYLKVYDLVLALTAGGPAGSTETIVFQIIKNSFDNSKLGFGAAQAVLLLIAAAAVGLALTTYRRRAEQKVSD